MSGIAERALHTRAARSEEALRRSFVDNLFYITGRSLKNASPVDLYTALAHTVRDKVEAAYARTDLLERRRPLMEAWATFCTRPAGGNVIPLHREAAG